MKWEKLFQVCDRETWKAPLWVNLYSLTSLLKWRTLHKINILKFCISLAAFSVLCLLNCFQILCQVYINMVFKNGWQTSSSPILRNLALEENFCLSKDGLGPSSDYMKATLLSNQVISPDSSSLEYHLTRKNSYIFRKEAFEDPPSQK